MVYEEIALFKDFGPVIALIIIMVVGGKWVLQISFEEVKLARKNFTDYVEKTEKEHTAAIHKMSTNISDLSLNLYQHTKTKEEFIDTFNEQRKTINELFEMLKGQIKVNFEMIKEIRYQNK